MCKDTNIFKTASNTFTNIFLEERKEERKEGSERKKKDKVVKS